MAEQEHESIVFSLEEEERQKSLLDEEREKRRARAERFGTEYKDPAKLPQFRQQARHERFRREGFATGIDMFSEEERAKRAARAVKFGLPAERVAPSYVPDPEDVKRAARAKKFGVDFKGPTPDTLLQKADLFEPRKDAPEDVPRREVAIYLYGIDLLSTADVLCYFGDYGPSLVEWINDSSCCVVFEDAASTRRAIAGSGHPLAPEELASAPDSMDIGLEPGQMSFLWHKGRDFIKGKTVVPLMYRMATDLDQKDPHADKRSRYLWKGKRRYDDYQQQQQQQPGQQQDRHRRGSRHGQDGWQDYDGEEGCAADVSAAGAAAGEGARDEGMRGARRQRRGGRGQQRQPGSDGAAAGEGDEEMADAEEDAAAGDAAGPAAGVGDAVIGDATGAEGGVGDLRALLKQRDAERRQAEEELPYEEVPQPPSGDEEGSGGDAELHDAET